MDLNEIIPPKLYDAFLRADVTTVKQIISLSSNDLKKKTHLNTSDIVLVKSIVAKHSGPLCVTCNELLQINAHDGKISTGCTGIDQMLRGGYRKGTLTEIYGESGTGKTQLGLQAALHNWMNGTVYICTEDLFPIKRFEQIKSNIPNYNETIDHGKNVYVEHVTESQELLSCIKLRLPNLLCQNKISLIIIDSVAAPFRSEYSNYIQRAEEMKEVAIALNDMALQYKLAVLCINQVTASFDSTSDVLPVLGLAWSNMVSTRLKLVKSTECIKFSACPEETPLSEVNYHVRELSIVFSSYLPNNIIKFIITSKGVQNIEETLK